MSVTSQFSHFGIYPQELHSIDGAYPLLFLNIIIFFPILIVSLIFIIKLSEKNSSFFFLLISSLRSIIDIFGIFKPLYLTNNSTYPYLPLIMLLYDSAEGVADPNKVLIFNIFPK